MLCVLILYMSGGTYSLKSTPNDRFVGNFFIVILFNLKTLNKSLHRNLRMGAWQFYLLSEINLP